MTYCYLHGSEQPSDLDRNPNYAKMCRNNVNRPQRINNRGQHSKNLCPELVVVIKLNACLYSACVLLYMAKYILVSDLACCSNNGVS
jgi:hypothetical protein